MQTLQSLFTIDKASNTLNAFDNTVYKKIAYTSILHADLDCELQDPILAKTIFDSYERHLAPTLTQRQKEHFEKAIVEVALLFGSDLYSPLQALEKTIRSKDINYDEWALLHKNALLSFIKDTVLVKAEQIVPKKPYKICLLHTTASGGNSAVTRAIEGFLRQQGQECHTIDVETLAQEHDAMTKATGFTYDGVYAEFFQKRNEAGTERGLKLVLTDRAALNKEIALYVKPRTQEILKQKIAAIAPDLILSSRSYTNEDINLAYSLGIPMRLIYCDYDLFIHTNHIGKTHPGLFKFWVPSLTTKSFEFLFDSLGAKSEYSAQDPWKTVAQKIARLTNSTFEKIDASFEEIGYPVGPEYTRITDAQKLAEIRLKWDVLPNEKLVIVTMGKNGVGVMEEIFSTLSSSAPHTIAIKYLFICGSNKELYTKLSTQLAKSDVSKTALQRITVTGFISHDQMSEVMNICSLKCSKPGGGAAAQCRRMGVPMFSMFAHSLWESGNERELREAGLVFKHDPNGVLTQQIEAAITQYTPQPFVEPVDWKAKITLNLQKAGFGLE